ncbi:MAG: hypothetical protein HY709_01580 [Candidatus Latescibacteria bacterium]|nr:hypothetical protein [Candidatus Latescibacterota bacterium]
MIAFLRFIALYLLLGFLFRLIRSVIEEFRRPVVRQERVRPQPKPLDAEDVDYEEIEEKR